jgi:hypothetical protein
VSEPFNRVANYIVVSTNLRESLDIARGTYHISEVVVKNTDLKGGTFVIIHKIYNANGLFGTQTTSKYVGNGSTVTFTAEFDTQFLVSYNAEYSVSAPTISGENTVTKKGTAYKSIIDLWLNR